jgi:hypothetical protein
MMKSILLFSLLLFAQGLSAQNLKVTVRDADAPLAFASIWINGIYLTSADSTGVVTIPESKLAPGDTISSTFLGFEPAFVVYDEALQATGSVTLVHSTERTYDIDEVVVRGSMDPWDAFKLYVRRQEPVFSDRCQGDFEMLVKMEDQADRNISGHFSISGINHYNMNSYYRSKVKFSAIRGDTTGVSSLIKRRLSYSERVAADIAWCIYRIKLLRSAYYRPYWSLKYLGLTGEKRHFVLTSAVPQEGTQVSQYLIEVDAESKHVTAIYFASMMEYGTKAEVNTVDVTLEGRGWSSTFPTVDFDFREVDGVKMTMKLTNLKYK